MLDKVNPKVIGYALNVVGLFFLASAISFKKPRRQIEEVLGVERPRSLFAVRDQLVNQVQTYIGFVMLVVGFVLLMSEALNVGRTATASTESAEPKLVWIVLILVAATLTTTGVLKLVQLVYVRSKFRRLVREVVRTSKVNLEKNPNMALQIGELLRIPKDPDKSVTEYIEQIRKTLGLGASEPPRSNLRRPFSGEPESA